MSYSTQFTRHLMTALRTVLCVWINSLFLNLYLDKCVPCLNMYKPRWRPDSLETKLSDTLVWADSYSWDSFVPRYSGPNYLTWKLVRLYSRLSFHNTHTHTKTNCLNRSPWAQGSQELDHSCQDGSKDCKHVPHYRRRRRRSIGWFGGIHRRAKTENEILLRSSFRPLSKQSWWKDESNLCFRLPTTICYLILLLLIWDRNWPFCRSDLKANLDISRHCS